MEVIKHLIQACLILALQGYVSASEIRFWNKHIEVSAQTLQVHAGSRVNLRCDALRGWEKPHVVWYGPDRHWITANKGRVRVQKSRSQRFLKLIISKMQAEDQGDYICRVYFGPENQFDTRPVRLVLVDTPPPPLPSTTKSTPDNIRIRTTLPSETTTATTATTATTTIETTTTAAATTTAATTTETTVLTNEDSCLEPKFRCKSGQCFDENYVCDSFPDCPDGEDEDNCGGPICLEKTVACKTGNQCIPKDQVCDGIKQCQDASDEAPDVCESTTVYSYY